MSTKPPQICPECSNTFIPTRNGITFCSIKCRLIKEKRTIIEAYKEARKASFASTTSIECLFCKKPFQPSVGKQKFCTPTCVERSRLLKRKCSRVKKLTEKTCLICNTPFMPTMNSPRYKYCSMNCRHTAYYNKRKSNPEVWAKYKKEYREKNIESWRKTRLKHWYGITIEQYYALFESQDNKCAICGEPLDGKWSKKTHIDHKHGGAVRGILCRSCNGGLGFFKDNPIILQRAIEYLNSHNHPSIPKPNQV